MSKRISSVLVVILFLQIDSNIASYQETSLGELTEPVWCRHQPSLEYMELPNVSIISRSGAGSKLMILIARSWRMTGFILLSHNTERPKEDTRLWKIQLGTVLLIGEVCRPTLTHSCWSSWV